VPTRGESERKEKEKANESEKETNLKDMNQAVDAIF